MKNLFIICLIVLLSPLWRDGTGQAQTAVFIPDTNFRNCLNNDYPFVMNGTGDSLIISAASSISGLLNCSFKNISDLTGVEYFTNITLLLCTGNSLTVLPPFDSLSALEYLDCSSNQLTSLPNLSGCPALAYIDCYGNELDSLPNLSANTSLTTLICFSNQLTFLPDLSTNTSLKTLSCNVNQLTVLPDLSSNNALQGLYCGFNQLTSIPDLSSNISLENIDVRGNQLTSLPALSSNVALISLSCSDNLLATLPDLTANTALSSLICDRNMLTILPDLLANDSLEILWCDSNLLTSLPDLSNNTSLKNLLFNYNYVAVMPDLSSNVALETIQAYDNELTSIPDLSPNVALQTRDFRNNRLDFSDARELRIAEAMTPGVLFEVQKPFGTADTITVAPGGTLMLSIASQDSALSYQWFRGTDTIAGATDTILVISNVLLADSGIYTCRSYGTALLNPPMVYSLGEFVSEGIMVNISTVGVEEQLQAESISVYPNPSNGHFSVLIKSEKSMKVELKIIDIQGRVVYSKLILRPQTSHQESITLNTVKSGLYFLVAETDQGRLIKKLVVQ